MPLAEREVGTMMAPATMVMNIENRQVLHRQKVQRVLNNLPPFSIILNRLIGSLSSENVRFSDLASLIEKDTVLSGHVLRLVNSAAMARRSRINSIGHAVSVLGLVRLRNFLLSLSIARLWQSTRTVSPWSMAQFNLHGAAVALLSDLLAQNCHCHYPEGAFLAGLLHDYGKLLIAAALPEQFVEIQRQLGEGHLTLIELEHELTGFTHPELSAMTLRAWSLPEDIVRGVEYHHIPDAEEQTLLEPVGGMLLGRIVFTADAVAHQMGLHVTNAEGSLEVRREQAIGTLEALGFAGKANMILESFESEFEAIRKFF
ncbi:MAG: HDOD domain-containing protein [Bryobacter sp.]|nr:HDOD domain-containing protein [Bryobacter sp. CoA8 C33]